MVLLSSTAFCSARAEEKVAALDGVQPTLATGGRPATQHAELPLDVLVPQLLSGGSSQPRLGKPQPQYRANDISLEGHLSTQIIGGVLNIHADKLANNRSGGTSGTLRISLWATT